MKFLDWMISRAINIVTLPVHWAAVLAVAAALLDRHELTGEEVGQIARAASTAAVVSTPDEMERGCCVSRSPAVALKTARGPPNRHDAR